jgi:hypothetical protein
MTMVSKEDQARCLQDAVRNFKDSLPVEEAGHSNHEQHDELEAILYSLERFIEDGERPELESVNSFLFGCDEEGLEFFIPV